MKMTIYVPDDLRRRMDAVKKEGVNWSQAACQAFEAKLAEITARKGVKSMKSVIDRLRASKNANEGEAFKEGAEAGREWAKESAEAVELQRLGKARHPTENWYFGIGQSSWGEGVRFYTMIADTHPDKNDYCFEQAKEFWDEIGISESQSSDPSFVNGFAHGAMEIWDEVSDRL